MLQFKDFLYSLLRHWKRFVLVGVIMAIVGGSVYASTLFGGKLPSETVAPIDRTAWYEAKNCYVATLKYASIGNERVAGTTVQDGYAAHLYGTPFKQHLQQSLPFLKNESLSFISNVVSIGNGGLTNCLMVKCLYYDEASCRQLASVVQNYIANLNPTMAAGFGDHRVFLVDASVEIAYVDSDVAWVETVKAFLGKEAAERAGGAAVFSLRSAVMAAGLFAVVGVFLAALWVIVSDALCERMYNAEVAVAGQPVPVLGDFSYGAIRGAVSGWLYRLLVNSAPLAKEETAHLASHALRGTASEVLLVGRASAEELRRLCVLLETESAGALHATGLSLKDKNAPRFLEWNTATPVVYVARRFEENQQTVQKQVEAYTGVGLSVAGLLFI